MKKLELYYYPQCPYCQIVENALRVTGLESSVTMYDTNDEPHRRDELIKLTGRATVPCLFIDGKPMHESKDISAWLHLYAKEISHKGEHLSGN